MDDFTQHLWQVTTMEGTPGVRDERGGMHPRAYRFRLLIFTGKKSLLNGFKCLKLAFSRLKDGF